jgi:hypothetical protein
MTSRARALLTFGGLAAALGAVALFGVVPAGMLSLATLWFAASGPSVIGRPTATSDARDVDPRAVRRYRADHPGTTISEAVTTIGRQ